MRAQDAIDRLGLIHDQLARAEVYPGFRPTAVALVCAAGLFAAAAHLLRPAGRLLAVTLGKHDHRAAVEPFDHRNLGFTEAELRDYATAAGLQVVSCNRLSRERKAPHFEVISLLAQKK